MKCLRIKILKKKKKKILKIMKIKKYIRIEIMIHI